MLAKAKVRTLNALTKYIASRYSSWFLISRRERERAFHSSSIYNYYTPINVIYNLLSLYSYYTYISQLWLTLREEFSCTLSWRVRNLSFLMPREKILIINLTLRRVKREREPKAHKVYNKEWCGISLYYIACNIKAI